MRTQHARRCSRRRFLGELTLAGTAGLLGLHARRVAAEPPPETTRIRLVRIPSICQAPAYVGLDPRKDINVVTHPGPESIQLLSEGKIDASLGFPPEPQEMREKQSGHVVANSTVDRPWSQDFCCMLAGNREFVRTHPVATKRALRAILKAADVCALDPEQSARFMVDQGYTKRYDYALQSIKEIPYGQWRE